MARGAGDVGGHRGSRIRRFQWSSEGENTIGVGSRQNGGENFKKKTETTFSQGMESDQWDSGWKG